MSKVGTLIKETVAAAQKHGVFPDVLQAFQPSGALNITYKSKQVQPGAELSVAETQELPKIEAYVPSINAGSSYTLVVTDPDAPRRGDPTWSEYAHYLVSDIRLDPSKSGEFQQIDFSRAQDLLSYFGPGPPPKTSLHRYVFLLFEGSTTKKPSDRPNWGLGKPGAGAIDFLSGEKVTPIALNFFVAQNTTESLQ